MENSQENKWQECLRIIRDNLSPEAFDAWFKPTEFKSFVEVPEEGISKLTLSVPTPFFVEYLEENYCNLIASAIRRVYGKNTKLYYYYNQVQNQPDTAVEIKSTNPSKAVKKGLSDANPFNAPAQVQFDSQLNPRYNFENYCGGESNRIALTIGRAIGDNPENKTFNPLFIFGPSGVGKTHLLHAIGLSVKEHRPDMRVLYISSRLFESQFTAASNTGRVNDFLYFYQSIDVLIIDDIQDLIGKDKTQNAFFHIFNHLQLNGKQIIISSDCSPSQMKGMPERIQTRMKWGVTVELGRPDIALRREVLRLRAAQDGLSIPIDVLDFIAENVTGSIRELEGIVVSLLAHATVLGREVTHDLARSVISNAVKINKRQVNFEMILDSVCEYYNIEPDALFTKSRKREISDARQMVMFMAKEYANMSFIAIGTRLSRTHATVIYACDSIKQRLSVDKQLSAEVDAIRKTFI